MKAETFMVRIVCFAVSLCNNIFIFSLTSLGLLQSVFKGNRNFLIGFLNLKFGGFLPIDKLKIFNSKFF